MILCSPEMDKFIIPLNWEIKPFDLKLINNLERNYPYQKIIFYVSSRASANLTPLVSSKV